MNGFGSINFSHLAYIKAHAHAVDTYTHTRSASDDEIATEYRACQYDECAQGVMHVRCERCRSKDFEETIPCGFALRRTFAKSDYTASS